jgi:signal transduction histidine kinase
VVKHADATQVNLDLVEKEENLFVTIEDNGKGFKYKPEMLRKKGAGFGIFSIQQRIEDIGGRLEIDTAPGKGTIIKLVVSLTD